MNREKAPAGSNHSSRAVPPLGFREGRETRGTMGLWAGVKFLVKEMITYKTVKVRRPRPGLPAKTECSFAPLTTNPERPSNRSPDARHPHRFPPPVISQLVKTYDKTLILLHLFFMSLITTYAFYSIVVSHSYMTVSYTHLTLPTKRIV